MWRINEADHIVYLALKTVREDLDNTFGFFESEMLRPVIFGHQAVLAHLISKRLTRPVLQGGILAQGLLGWIRLGQVRRSWLVRRVGAAAG